MVILKLGPDRAQSASGILLGKAQNNDAGHGLRTGVHKRHPITRQVKTS